jgi:hypothetical protein
LASGKAFSISSVHTAMASFISIDWQVFKVTPLLATSFWNCLCTQPISSWRLFIFYFCWNIFPISSSLDMLQCLKFFDK